MDVDQVGRRSSRMWAKLGRVLEERAYERAAADSALDAAVALSFARRAEACFWQSTGDEDAIDLKDVL